MWAGEKQWVDTSGKWVDVATHWFCPQNAISSILPRFATARDGPQELDFGGGWAPAPSPARQRGGGLGRGLQAIASLASAKIWASMTLSPAEGARPCPPA